MIFAFLNSNNCLFKCKSADVIEPLVAHGASLTCLDEQERSPLMYAAQRGNTPIIQALVMCGAQVL